MKTKIKIWGFFVTVIVVTIVIGFGKGGNDRKIEPATVPTRQHEIIIGNDHISNDAESSLITREIVLMGSQFTFVMETQRETGNLVMTRLSQALKNLEDRISSWHPASEVFKVNELAGIRPVKVSEETFRLIQTSIELYEETDGAFDVTIGALWDIWPFNDPLGALPTPAEIKRADDLVGSDQIILSERSKTVFLPKEGMKINLGAIGKGYAAQEAISLMKENGIVRAAVSAGGDITLLGEKSSGPWLIGVENPRWPDKYLQQFLLSDMSVATSGDYERFIEREGKRYGHILDPNSGYPVEHCQSATIITRNAVKADAYATAVFVKGPLDGIEWVNQRPLTEALVVDLNGNIHKSAGWDAVTANHGRQDRSRNTSESKHTTASNSGSRRTAPPTAHQPTDHRKSKNLVPMKKVPRGHFLLGDKKEAIDLTQTVYIDETEVTNRQYKQFLHANRNIPHLYCHVDEPANKDHEPRYWKNYLSPFFKKSEASELAPFTEDTFREPDHPVVGVDWWDAYAFANWAGKRLPSMLEWEKATRGTDGRIWPWGDQWEYERANTGGEKWAENDGYTYAAPANSFTEGASIYGLLNMAGNVAEWTDEGYVAGGSSRSNPSQVRCAAYEEREPDYRSFDIGFRCAAN
ncbi:MAG: SUMF1/EgtB/PvdO family nonheme iron enzyme [Bacteroidetes bacterium]|nr:SUMF1/EgtB/PvdO family nonheme iron enzyme [Bacteroidota bacterium]